MINVDTLKQFIEYVSNKEQRGGYLPAKEFNMLLPRAVDDFFNERYGLPESYRPGYPLPPQAYEVTKTIKEDLRHLKENEFLNVDSEGKATIPDDYVHYTKILYRKVTNTSTGPEVKLVPVEMLDDDQFDSRKLARIKKPSKRKPVGVINNDHFEFYPKDLYKVKLTYLRYPKEPKWANTVQDDEEIYDPSNSIDIELPKNNTNKIAHIILGYMGIHIREQSLYQYAEGYQQRGS